jgi:sulfide:quinone oxidoreductase
MRLMVSPVSSPDMSGAETRVVIAGGGVAGLEAALAARQLSADASVELITGDASFAYRQLSVLEPFTDAKTVRVSYDALRARGITVTQGLLSRVQAPGHLAVLADGDARRFDALLVAVGAAPRVAVRRAITFTGPASTDLLRQLVDDVDRGAAHRVAFVVPHGVTWALPLYELALQLAARTNTAQTGAETRIITSESRPLEVFGSTVSAHIERMLERARIAVDCGVEVSMPSPGSVVAGSAAARPVDRVIALPVLTGRPISGLPATVDGFIPVDTAGRVHGVPGVFAAGDGTDGAIKQGGVAAQQADRAVATMLAEHGVDVPAPADPHSLNALLITGADTWYLRRRADSSDGEISARPLWWPPSKVVGHHLSPFLDALTPSGMVPNLEPAPAAAPLEGDA